RLHGRARRFEPIGRAGPGRSRARSGRSSGIPPQGVLSVPLPVAIAEPGNPAPTPTPRSTGRPSPGRRGVRPRHRSVQHVVKTEKSKEPAGGAIRLLAPPAGAL